METKTIQLNNLDTPYTVDTYATFAGNTYTEMLCNDYDCDYDDLDYEVNMQRVVVDLAQASIDFILENHDIFSAMQLVRTHIPKFYNYTTDSYVADLTVDLAKLDAWLKANKITTQIIQEFSNEFRGYPKTITPSESLDWQVLYYLKQEADADEHNMNLWDAERQIYADHSTHKELTLA